jgi:hypothetical protein
MKQIPPLGAKVIVLDTGTLSLIDPDITEKEMIDLYKSGYEQTKGKMEEINQYVKNFLRQ